VTREWEAALHRGDLQLLEQLLDDGTDINALDRLGQTSLMIAAHHGQAAVVRLLVTRGAALDRSAKYRLTALMLAVIGGQADVVRLLVDAGADRTIRGTGAPGFDGKTALDLARAAGRSDLEACFTDR
jgi:ankyrin repeat protein